MQIIFSFHWCTLHLHLYIPIDSVQKKTTLFYYSVFMSFRCNALGSTKLRLAQKHSVQGYIGGICIIWPTRGSNQTCRTRSNAVFHTRKNANNHMQKLSNFLIAQHLRRSTFCAVITSDCSCSRTSALYRSNIL